MKCPHCNSELSAAVEAAIKKRGEEIAQLDALPACTTQREWEAAVAHVESARNELINQVRLTEQYREAAEKAEAALTTTRIDGARAWCDFLIAEDAYIGHGGMGIESAKTAFARWLASESKEVE